MTGRARLLVPALFAVYCATGSGPPPCPPAPDPARAAALAREIEVPPGEPARGEELFALHCTRCHAPEPAQRDSRLFAAYPKLDCAAVARMPEAWLFAAIERGGPAVGRDPLMKPFGEVLSRQQIADLVAHLRAASVSP